MNHVYEVLGRRVDKWRADGYPARDSPAIGEIFEWASDPDSGTARDLRRPQLWALETYWHLRLDEARLVRGDEPQLPEAARPWPSTSLSASTRGDSNTKWSS